MPPWLLGASRRARPPGLVARLLVACIACCLRDGTPAQQLEEIALESPSHLAQLWEGGLREMSRAVEAAGNPDNLPADCLRGDASAFGCLLPTSTLGCVRRRRRGYRAPGRVRAVGAFQRLATTRKRASWRATTTQVKL